MSLSQLVNDWWGSGHPELYCFARNFMLDIDDQTIKKPYMPAISHGNRLNASHKVNLDDDAANWQRSPWFQTGTDWPKSALQDLRKAIEWAFSGRNKARLTSRPSAYPGVTESMKVVRYVPMRAVCEYWLGLPKLNKDEVRAQIGKVVKDQARLAAAKAKELYSNNDLGGGSICWVAPQQQSTFPHQDPTLPKSDPDKTEELVRRLALGSLIEPSQRVDAVGLIAAVYDMASTDLLTPDILDAGGHWYFHPGEKGKPYGQTAPLDPNFAVRRELEAGGYWEYVHRMCRVKAVNPRLEVVGYF
ncbi:MAG: hypothetical protein HQL56_10010 [Magnetococcales bacterium]|nr:hypothetical protein [Magnetococcales bacterium]